MLEFPCAVMRGGTSKGLFFLEKDLPDDAVMRDKILCRCFGSPDPSGLQINGLGGMQTNMNKLAVISPRTGEPNTVNYGFGQIDIYSWHISRNITCGNISSAVGPFAIENGLIADIDEPVAKVNIFDVNTQKYIVAHVPVHHGQVVYEGDFCIPGVPGTGSKIRLDFLEPGGSSTGALLPTGEILNILKTRDYGEFEVSIVDAANCFVYVRAADLGMTGAETADEINANRICVNKLIQIREAACIRLGWARDEEDARRNFPVLPKICFVAPPKAYSNTAGERFAQTDFDILIRMIEVGKANGNMALTGCLNAAVASKIKGTIAHAMTSPEAEAREELLLGHAGGVMPIRRSVEYTDGAYHAISATVFRTARKMMTGTIFVIP